MLTVIANIQDASGRILQEQEFQVENALEFVANQKFGEFYVKARREVALELAKKYVENLDSLDGFRFKSIDGTREIEVLITV